MNGAPGVLRRVDATGVPALLARLALGYLFITMGWHKAMDPVEFLKLIREYQMFPHSLHIAMNLVAVVLPWLEIFCGVLLLLGVAVRGTALTLLVMLVAFTILVTVRAIGIYGAEHIPFCSIKFDCGCGAGVVHICSKLLENTGLILLSLYLLWSRPRLFALLPALIPASKQNAAPTGKPAAGD